MRRNLSARRALELVCIRVAPDHERGALGDAPLALPQRHAAAPREIDQFFQRAYDTAARRSDARSLWAALWCRPRPVRDHGSPGSRSCVPPTGSPGSSPPAALRPGAGANVSVTRGQTAGGISAQFCNDPGLLSKIYIEIRNRTPLARSVSTSRASSRSGP
jgi:hypothetical protein